jgi:hypothetical protein
MISDYAIGTNIPEETHLDKDGLPDEGFLTGVCAGIVTIDHRRKRKRTGHNALPDEDEDVRLYKRVRLLQKKYRDKPKPPENVPGIAGGLESINVRSSTTVDFKPLNLDMDGSTGDRIPSDHPSSPKTTPPVPAPGSLPPPESIPRPPPQPRPQLPVPPHPFTGHKPVAATQGLPLMPVQPLYLPISYQTQEFRGTPYTAAVRGALKRAMASTYPQSSPMGQSPFFYYNADPKPDNRQHGHFSQHHNFQAAMHYQPMPSTPTYSPNFNLDTILKLPADENKSADDFHIHLDLSEVQGFPDAQEVTFGWRWSTEIDMAMDYAIEQQNLRGLHSLGPGAGQKRRASSPPRTEMGQRLHVPREFLDPRKTRV